MTRKQRPTRKFLSLEALEDRLCLSSLPVGTSTTVPDAATQAHLSAAYGQLPLSFEANQGQTDPRVNFLSRGAGYSLFLTPTKAVLALQAGRHGNVVGMRDRRGQPASHAVGLDKQAGVSNYLIGNDPSKWHTDVANYAKVDYQGVYRGINLVYHGDQKQLEYDFVVAPGRRPRRHPAGVRRHHDPTRSTPRATSSCTPPAETWSSTPRSPTRWSTGQHSGGRPVRAQGNRPGGLPGRPLRPQQAAGDRPGR